MLKSEGLLLLCIFLASVFPSDAIDSSAVIVIWNSTLTIPGSTGAATVLRTNQAAYADQASATTALGTATACSGSAATIASLCNSALDPCHADADCTSAASSLLACQCKTGYTDTSTTTYPPTNLVPPGTRCNETNECSTTAHNCHSEADCTNTIGSFTCTCKTSFTGDGVSCTAIPTTTTVTTVTTATTPTTVTTTTASSAPNLLSSWFLALFFGTLWSARDSIFIAL